MSYGRIPLSLLTSAGGDGAEVLYSLRNNDTLSKLILNNIEETGQNIRKLYQRKLPSNPNSDYYYIIRNTSPAESVLIEYAFLDSTKDDHDQIKNDWQKWAEAVVKSVAEYKGYSYLDPDYNTVNDVYRVQKGDSLWSIAKKFNVGVDELKEINRLNNNLITVGQELVIPGVAPSNQTNTTYIVQKGDTLYKIANANNTTVDEIANLNDLDTNDIYIGQMLVLPNNNPDNLITGDDNLEYVVQNGDTLYNIALRYNTTPEAIIDKNNLISSTLYIGQVLQIPSDVESTGNDSDVIEDNTYIVQSGDTLYSISIKYNVSVDDLKNYNNLTSNTLSIGQVIKIPNDNNKVIDGNNSSIYIVEKGDNLWNIARKYNVSLQDLRLINNLTSDLLSVGQMLIIP